MEEGTFKDSIISAVLFVEWELKPPDDIRKKKLRLLWSYFTNLIKGLHKNSKWTSIGNKTSKCQCLHPPLVVVCTSSS